MSNNPKAALEAILAAPIKIAPGLFVHPLSIDLFAKLDMIGCPALNKKPCRVADMIPSYYLMTHPEADLDGVAAASAAWARTISAGLYAPLSKAFARQVKLAEAVVPVVEDEGGGKKKARTAV